jgi:hypothetical protein
VVVPGPGHRPGLNNRPPFLPESGIPKYRVKKADRVPVSRVYWKPMPTIGIHERLPFIERVTRECQNHPASVPVEHPSDFR